MPNGPVYPSEQLLAKNEQSLAKKADANADLIAALKQQITYLKQDIPGNFPVYMNFGGATNDMQVRETDFNGVDQILAEWNLDPRVTDFLRNVKFADSASIHTLGFQVQAQTGATVEETVAAGTNYDGKILMAFIKTRTSGSHRY